MRKILTAFAFMLCLLWGCDAPKQTDLAQNQQAGSGKLITVLVWNIKNGMWSDQGNNYDNFVEWVKGYKPDVCIWCEARSNYQTGSKQSMPKDQVYLPDGWGELAARYGHSYWAKGGHRDNFPQVITSKYPIHTINKIIGNGADSVVTHGCGHHQLVVNERVLNFVTLHTWPQKYAFGIPKQQRDSSKAVNGGDKYRRMEMECICKETVSKIAGAAQQYWMMMGDFNAKSRVDNWFYKWPQDTTAFLVHDYIHSTTPYIDVIKEKYPDKFFTTTGGKTRIDFFYCTAPLYKKITRAEVISDDYTTPVRNEQKISNFWHPSDHRPILVEIEL
jgi:endonuclease/exonuclease/phosphatase family metal-dependent hydrolase